MFRRALPPALVAAGACIAVLTTAPLAVAAPPAGYVEVISSLTFMAPGTQGVAAVSCPPGTVPYGGGVFVGTSNFRASINDSYPSGNAWIGHANNLSPVTQQFDVRLVCGLRPAGYVVRQGPLRANPTATQATASVGCPAGTRPLGGGSRSRSRQAAVSLNTSFPAANGWIVRQNNVSSKGAKFRAVTVCGVPLPGYVAFPGPTLPSPSLTQSFAPVACPAGLSPIAGGLQSGSNDFGISLNSTVVNGNRWDSYQNNSTAFDTTMTPWIICAGQ